MFKLASRIRFRVAKLLYDTSFSTTIQDVSWQRPLYESIGHVASNRVLVAGRGGASVASALAAQFPDAKITGADPNSQAVKKVRRVIARRKLANLTVVDAPQQSKRLPFDGATFDKAVGVLALHDRSPDEKVAYARELLRVLRRGGTLHLAEYDKPTTGRESHVLKLAERISGRAAVEPHLSGNWTTVLATAGFIGIRRQASQSVDVGRVAVVKARKH